MAADTPEYIDLLKERVRELEELLERRQAEFDEVSVEIALSISEFFEVMRRLTVGDFSVRAPEDSTNQLLANFGKIINETIEQLAKKSKDLEDANRKIKEQSEAELKRSADIIQRQRTALANLTTPIIQIWDEVLCLPVIGIVDSQRSAEMMETLLNKIIEAKCRSVIVDVTGVDVVDTQTADYFIKMIKAANLLGAHCIITGISPEVAQTLTHIGVDMSGIRTLRNLQDGLSESFKIMRLKVVQNV